jgi:hypothetical protein
MGRCANIKLRHDTLPTQLSLLTGDFTGPCGATRVWRLRPQAPLRLKLPTVPEMFVRLLEGRFFVASSNF